MDALKDKKIGSSPPPESESPAHGKDISLYDIIHSEELELLYKKNAHLLARLSKTGKENTRLFFRLSELTQEKSRLGDKNKVLKSKFLSLKEQISLFARQHREFNFQSKKLKAQLERVRRAPAAPNEAEAQEDLAKQTRELKLLEKKEQVYRRQIKNLQSLCRQKDSEREAESAQIQKEREKAVLSLEQKIQALYQALADERARAAKSHPAKIKQAHQDLHKKNKALAKKLSGAQKELEGRQKREEKLKGERIRLAKEAKKIKSYKKADLDLKKAHEREKGYKSQIADLTEREERMRAGFAKQIHLFSKERDSLKFQRESLSRALAGGHLGFDQAMLSFRRKYAKLYREKGLLADQFARAAQRAEALEEKARRAEERFLKEKKESEGQIKREKEKYIAQLCGELKAVKEHNKALESQAQSVKARASAMFLKESGGLREEIKSLRWAKEKSLLEKEESHKNAMEDLKSDYENRIRGMERSLKKRMEHIRIEMENELCSEKKRHEAFKSLKARQIQELEGGLAQAQSARRHLKTKSFVLEKSLAETKSAMERRLKDSKQWKERFESLKALWQDLQKQNEDKDQRIKSLQKLNRSLSLSLSQKNEKPAPAKPVLEKPSLASEKDFKKEALPASHVLADIHFD